MKTYALTDWFGEFWLDTYTDNNTKHSEPVRMWEATVPIWPFVLVLMLFVIPMVLRHRRLYRPGHCHQCGYNLTGTLAAGRGECPECGAVVKTGGQTT